MATARATSSFSASGEKVGRGHARRPLSDEHAEAHLLAFGPIDMLELAEADLYRWDSEPT